MSSKTDIQRPDTANPDTGTNASDTHNTEGTTDLQRLIRNRFKYEPFATKRTLAVLGELLGLVDPHRLETKEEFICRMLRSDPDDVETSTQEMSRFHVRSVGAVLNDLAAQDGTVVGPGRSRIHIEVLGESMSAPDNIALFLPAGALAAADVAVQLEGVGNGKYVLEAYCRKPDRGVADEALADVLARARGPRNLFRGRTLRPAAPGGGPMDQSSVEFNIIPTPTTRRDHIVVDDDIWYELDLNVAGLTTHRDVMKRLNLGTRRGILLSGPPGTGKTAISRAIAAELVGDFTVVFVDARSGAQLLPSIYRETRNLGPTVVVLDDIDLYVAARKSGGAGRVLADLLDSLDGVDQYDDILTIATTNDPRVLDKAAVRSARFDSVIEVRYPSREAAAMILDRYLSEVPGASDIDSAEVVAALPTEVSGADLREIVRRTVLAHGATFTTADMLVAVRTGRWRPAPLAGNYL